MKKKLLRLLFLEDFADTLSENDLVSKQRFRLFKITTLFSFIVFAAFIYQASIVLASHFLILAIISFLFCSLFINYFGVLHIRSQKFAYLSLVMILFALLHLVTYFQGGVRNSGMFYLAGLLLTAYMLLGNKGGKLMAVFSILHITYFYFVNRYTDWVNYALIGDEPQLIDLDFLLTASISIMVVTAQSNYIEKSKNAIIEDILEKKEELRVKNIELNKLSLVASKADNGVIITDSRLIIEWVNDGFVRLTGYPFEEVIGKKPDTLMIGEETDKDMLQSICERLKKGQSCSEELLKYHRNGSKIWIQENITPIKNDNGNIEKFIFIENDITPRKTAEAKMAEYLRNLEMTNKELDKFAYIVSHDLKAPLRAIGNLTGWIEEDMGNTLPDSVQSNFNIIKGRVVRMEALINGILDYSKASRNAGQNVSFDSKSVAQESFDLIGAGENCRLKITSGLPILITDKTKLQQVFLNLFNNAIKYNDKESPCIEVSASEEKNFWHFVVSDNGPGIDKQFHEKIFVIFQTLQARDEFESTGVGLAIVKKIIEEMGGQIWVESEPGSGAAFHFTWPRKGDKNTENIVQMEFLPV